MTYDLCHLISQNTLLANAIPTSLHVHKMLNPWFDSHCFRRFKGNLEGAAVSAASHMCMSCKEYEPPFLLRHAKIKVLWPRIKSNASVGCSYAKHCEVGFAILFSPHKQYHKWSSDFCLSRHCLLLWARLPWRKRTALQQPAPKEVQTTKPFSSTGFSQTIS